MAVVSEHPAPMLRAGPLEPMLRGLLTKDPAQRSTVPQARRQLEGLVAALAAHSAAAPQPAAAPPSPPPPAPGPVPGGSVERLDSDDLRALASASRALLGSVARDARDQARFLADRHRGRKAQERRGTPARNTAPPPRRRRFKRRWIVVPVLITVLLVLLLLGAAVWALGSTLGYF
jgi:hypothetical protein